MNNKARDHQTHAAPPTQGEQSPKGAQRVLLVDDNRELLDCASLVLKHKGYDVTAFDNPIEAIAAMSQLEYISKAFVDYNMPKKNGVDVSLAIKQAHPDAKVAIVSGYVSTQTREAAQAAGVDAVLEKPLPMKSYIAFIEHDIAS